MTSDEAIAWLEERVRRGGGVSIWPLYGGGVRLGFPCGGDGKASRNEIVDAPTLLAACKAGKKFT